MTETGFQLVRSVSCGKKTLHEILSGIALELGDIYRQRGESDEPVGTHLFDHRCRGNDASRVSKECFGK